MLCCIRLRAIADLGQISNRNFRKFSRPQNFAFEIARDRAKIDAAWWCAASSRPLEVPDICCERRHAVPRAISCDLELISDRNFRNSKLCVRNRARLHRNPCCLVVRSFLATLRGPQHLLRASACCAACDCVRSAADFEPKFSKIENFAFEIARDRA